MSETETEELKCPVPKDVRDAWLKQNQQESSNLAQSARDEEGTLSTDRMVSSIPKTAEHSDESSAERWVYPSPKMFYDAMKRKNFHPNAKDMQTIVPVHNAVNEQVWKCILHWEKGWGAEKCGGLTLDKFEGNSEKISPKARFLSLLGFTKPFDRHDWTVDRCGKKIVYVIDFYKGYPGPSGDGSSLYLDVRPKLTLEGIKMRLYHWWINITTTHKK
ncbi:cytochrome c1 heme lyase [Schizosaccharomyces japonicus yFS275]|uniref:Holocytochrome c-type synthase n=1 Tax=Schizosaccharomyces japonicus (strain yFS275 / FY16936) TaxID=402676 RepID=B6K3L0_SCHJY|nr:cytochrome c1 heme lyase [Schizosaccharomyces japonicus yFS275]EEB08067.1 cytochrome c1 heme lyase [Schizosaccharomyces japonicus yFS275]